MTNDVSMYSMTGGDKEILAGMMGEKTIYKLSEMRNGMKAANSGAVYNTTAPEFLEFSCRCSRPMSQGLGKTTQTL